jgi:hypothetical protein
MPLPATCTVSLVALPHLALTDAMRLDPDEHAFSVFRLGVFLGFTFSTGQPLMQAHVLELYERARGRAADSTAGIVKGR